jgi:hypothetical protein
MLEVIDQRLDALKVKRPEVIFAQNKYVDQQQSFLKKVVRALFSFRVAPHPNDNYGNQDSGIYTCQLKKQRRLPGR